MNEMRVPLYLSGATSFNPDRNWNKERRKEPDPERTGADIPLYYYLIELV